MSLPLFFVDGLATTSVLQLDEDTSRHIIQVLRMKEGEKLRLTDGRGHFAEATISDAHKKHAGVQIASLDTIPPASSKLTIAISLVKNASRFEWFLEKATEFGVHEVVPIICDRTERQKFRHDRMLGICKSAMLQSLQAWMPLLAEPVSFNDIISNTKQQQKMIAHCEKDAKVEFASLFNPSLESHIILIGPEGDFTSDEISSAVKNNFVPVSLGATRLRTETAGLFAAAWGSGAREVD